MTIEQFKNNWQPPIDSYERACFNLDLKELVQQIRAEVIDEVKIEYKRMFNCGYTDCDTCNDYCNARKFMDKLEQMKEQN